MAVLGERWTFVVLREVFNGIRGFEDMRVRTAIPGQVLTDRLSLLVGHGILRQVAYQPLADPDGPPVEFADRDCGQPVTVAMQCAGGHDIDEPREVVPRPGPGAISR